MNNQKKLIDFFNNLSTNNLDQYGNIGMKACVLVEAKYDEKIVLENF